MHPYIYTLVLWPFADQIPRTLLTDLAVARCWMLKRIGGSATSWRK